MPRVSEIEDEQGDKRLAQALHGPGPPEPGQGADDAPDREGDGGELERRNDPGGHRHHRKQRPHQDRGEADQGRGAGGHGAVMAIKAEQSMSAK